MQNLEAIAVRPSGDPGLPKVSVMRNGSSRHDSKPSICFVSETTRVERPVLDPSVRYRCYHPAEALSSQGYRVTVCAAAKFYENPSFDCDVYVFHRPSSSRRFFDRVIDHLESLGRTLIADYDDLIFGGEDVALVSSAVKNRNTDRDTAIRIFSANQTALERFNRFSVSTAPLAKRVHAIRPDARIAVVANELPESMLRPHLDGGTALRERSPRVIGYFAGTRSHNADFPVVKGVLHRILSEDARRTLLVVGPLELPKSIASLPNVLVRDVVPYWHLPDLMSACDTVIAPLERSAFNECKSRVKFLEAALAGCRLVATPIPDMEEVGPSRITFARNPDEWYDALSLQPTEADRLALVGDNIRFVTQRGSVAALQGVGGF